MISKLLLAVQECALAENIPNIKNELMECYEDIRLGLGFTKTADVYVLFQQMPIHTLLGISGHSSLE